MELVAEDVDLALQIADDLVQLPDLRFESFAFCRTEGASRVFTLDAFGLPEILVSLIVEPRSLEILGGETQVSNSEVGIVRHLGAIEGSLPFVVSGFHFTAPTFEVGTGKLGSFSLGKARRHAFGAVSIAILFPGAARFMIFSVSHFAAVLFRMLAIGSVTLRTFPPLSVAISVASRRGVLAMVVIALFAGCF